MSVCNSDLASAGVLAYSVARTHACSAISTVNDPHQHTVRPPHCMRCQPAFRNAAMTRFDCHPLSRQIVLDPTQISCRTSDL